MTIYICLSASELLGDLSPSRKDLSLEAKNTGKLPQIARYWSRNQLLHAISCKVGNLAKIREMLHFTQKGHYLPGNNGINELIMPFEGIYLQTVC